VTSAISVRVFSVLEISPGHAPIRSLESISDRSGDKPVQGKKHSWRGGRARRSVIGDWRCRSAERPSETRKPNSKSRKELMLEGQANSLAVKGFKLSTAANSSPRAGAMVSPAGMVKNHPATIRAALDDICVYVYYIDGQALKPSGGLEHHSGDCALFRRPVSRFRARAL